MHLTTKTLGNNKWYLVPVTLNNALDYQAIGLY